MTKITTLSLFFLAFFITKTRAQFITSGTTTTTTNNVGIGTNSPLSKLHVSGDVQINAGEGFTLYGGGTHPEPITFEIQDSNGPNRVTDGGFVFRKYIPKDQVAKE